jgi:AraC-like DNA-binding protein
LTDYFRQRMSDSPFIKLVWEARYAQAGELTVTADGTWDLVVGRIDGETTVIITGPTTKTGTYAYQAGQEAFGMQFRPGTYLPGMPAREVINASRQLPNTRQTFQLKNHTFPIPAYDTAEAFARELFELQLLARDTVVEQALQAPVPIPARSVQRHFSDTTGLPLSQHQHIARAQQAASLLRQGMDITAVVHECGYFDQAHLNRSLKQILGVTPKQIQDGAAA